VADVSDGTAAGLVAFLEWAGGRGEINAGTASSRAVAVRRVLEIENSPMESIDLRQLEVDDLLNRFETLKRLDYTTESMKVYKSRFRASVDAYLAWLDKRPDWKRPRRQVSVSDSGSARERVYTARLRVPPNRPSKASAADSLSDDSEVSQSTAASPAGMTPMIPYEVPLRTGGELRARLVLPADLSRADADRLCRFISSLAFELPTTPQDGDTSVVYKD
jgi:hypothetical protein